MVETPTRATPLGDDSGQDDEQDWENWEDEHDPGAEEEAQSLFDSSVLPSADAAFGHDLERHAFDLRAFIAQHKLGDHDAIKLINYIRRQVADGSNPREDLQMFSGGAKPWQDDKYLQTVLEDDVLLMYDFQQDALHSAPEQNDELQQLRDENAAMKEALEQLRNAAIQDLGVLPAEESKATAPQASSSSLHQSDDPTQQKAPPRLSRRQLEARRNIDESYFQSYGEFGIHKEMLSDKARTEAYRDAIMSNAALFKDKRVLDVGCGTGILSMFAAKAGAAAIIGVDGSERIAGIAKRIVAANNQASGQGGPISILSGRLEALPSLPVDKVDIIVSEWMGYALLFETMLDTVLYCRDRWLAPGGVLFPCEATLHLAAAGPRADNAGPAFWQDVYGFSMQVIGDMERERDIKVAAVSTVDPKHLISHPSLIHTFDLSTLTLEQTELSQAFELALLPDQVDTACHAFVLWFDVAFPAPPSSPATILSTSPHKPVTHWAQTVLTLRDPIVPAAPTSSAVNGNGTRSIAGRLSLARASQHRGLDISVEYDVPAGSANASSRRAQVFSMSMS